MIGLIEKQNAPLVRRAKSGLAVHSSLLYVQIVAQLEHKVKPRTASPTPQEVGT